MKLLAVLFSLIASVSVYAQEKTADKQTVTPAYTYTHLDSLVKQLLTNNNFDNHNTANTDLNSQGPFNTYSFPKTTPAPIQPPYFDYPIKPTLPMPNLYNNQGPVPNLYTNPGQVVPAPGFGVEFPNAF